MSGPPGSTVVGKDGKDGTSNDRGTAPCGGDAAGEYSNIVHVAALVVRNSSNIILSSSSTLEALVAGHASCCGLVVHGISFLLWGSDVYCQAQPNLQL